MRVPFSWLQDFVEIEGTAEGLARRLQEVGLPVEGVEREGPDLSGIVVARITQVGPHPQADRLRVCAVVAGEGVTLQVVTAAPNVREGMTVALALHGARLADGTQIKKGRLRGEVSEGMFCSARELGMDEDGLPPEQREGILDLEPGHPPGTDLHRVLPLVEEVLVLETFANRPDHLSLIGVAREVAAALGRPLRQPPLWEEGEAPSWEPPSVEVRDPQGCPRYLGRVVEGLQVGPSPAWMVRRLRAAGLRSVNNVVDVTNYVMWETGQPLHAFDLDRLAGRQVIVRRSTAGEGIVTLDGQEHPLPEGTLVIADRDRPVAVAGVMGGLHSEVGEATTRILLEAAAFAPSEVRRASLRLGLRTESSKRFEKGLDLARTDWGSARAAWLLEQLGGRVLPGLAAVGADPPPARIVTLRSARLAQVLGLAIPMDEARAILEGLEFACAPAPEGIEVRVPTFRQDVAAEIDLVEEVARHFGYDRIPSTVPQGRPSELSDVQEEGEEWTREALARLGWSEVIHPSLHSLELLARARIQADPATIMNPLSEDQRTLRVSLLPLMLETVGRNLRVRNRELRLFEVGRIFEGKGDGLQERPRLMLALSLPSGGFFSLKGALERLGQLAGVGLSWSAGARPWLHPGRAAELMLGGEPLGWAGELHPALAEELGLEAQVALAELDLERLLGHRRPPRHRAFSRFPSVERDLALVVAEEVPAGALAERLLGVGGDLLEGLVPFDVYRGAQVPEGRKSVALRATLQAPDRTLTEGEIERVLRKLLKVAEREFQATLRG